MLQELVGHLSFFMSPNLSYQKYAIVCVFLKLSLSHEYEESITSKVYHIPIIMTLRRHNVAIPIQGLFINSRTPFSIPFLFRSVIKLSIMVKFASHFYRMSELD